MNPPIKIESRPSRPADRGLAGLMRRYVDGDERGFSELHARLKPRLRAQIRTRIRDEERVRDLLQLTFMKAHAARERFATPPGRDPDRAVATWYATIARHATFDHLRSVYRSKPIVGDPIEDLALDELVVHEDPETLALTSEHRQTVRRVVREAVDTLPTNQRSIVRMHKLEGSSMAEAAETLGVKPGALRVRAHRGYEKLRGLLRGHPDLLAA